METVRWPRSAVACPPGSKASPTRVVSPRTVSREREGEGIPIDRRPNDLRVVCRQIIDQLKGIARDRQITLDCEVDGSGAWDEHRIMQAISNLASNAVQHGTPGSAVRVLLTGDDERVAVEVHNRGSIPSELLPHIFEPFRSGRHHANRGDGLGLGLFIANAIACARRRARGRLVPRRPSACRRRTRSMVQVSGAIPHDLTPGCLTLMSHLPAAAFFPSASQFSRA